MPEYWNVNVYWIKTKKQCVFMDKQMRAFVLIGPRKVRETRVRTPVAGPHEVLVKTKIVGICGSDLHLYNLSWMNPKNVKIMKRSSQLVQTIPVIPKKAMQIMEKPVQQSLLRMITQRFRKMFHLSFADLPFFIMGHEFSGTVERCGAEVTDADLGQRVGVTPNIACHKCAACKSGYESLCVTDTEIGSGDIQGALCEFVKVPSENIVPFPSHLSFEEAAMLDCVAPALHAVNLAQIEKHHSVAILGAGTIGLLVLQILRAFGLRNLAITDVNDFNLEIAKRFGAKRTFNVLETNDVSAEMEKTLGYVDRVVECVGGAAPTMTHALKLVGFRGRIVVVGNFDFPQPIDIVQFRKKEASLVGCSRYSKPELKEALRMMADGDIDVKSLITHKFPAYKVEEAFRVALKKRQTKAIKVQIEF